MYKVMSKEKVYVRYMNNIKHQVKLSEVGDNLLYTVKAIKDLTGKSLKESKDIADSIVANGIPHLLSFNSREKAKRAVSALTAVGCFAAYDRRRTATIDKLVTLRDMIEEFDMNYKGPIAGRKAMRSIGDLGYIDKIIMDMSENGLRLIPKDVDRLNKMYHYYKKKMIAW